MTQQFCSVGTHVRELKTNVHIKTPTGMFTVPLFITAKKKKQPKCLSPDEWVNRGAQPYSGILFSNSKAWSTDPGNNVDKHWKRYSVWKKSVTIDGSIYMNWLDLHEMSSTGKSTEREEWLPGAGGGWGRWEWVLMHMGFPVRRMKIF